MFRLQHKPPEGDPSKRVQIFEEIRPWLHCCRYWWLSDWRSQHMSFPYWRMYWNRTEGAYVVYKKTVCLDPSRVILIPPHTPFASEISGRQRTRDLPYSLNGGWIENREMEQQMIDEGRILHLFIHFTLGNPYDAVAPGIFELAVSEEEEILLSRLTSRLMEDGLSFDTASSMDVYSLLFSLLGRLPAKTWQHKRLDKRVLKAIQYMEENLVRTDIRNQELAVLNHMSDNSFARLFREQTGKSPRQYLIRLRIEKACTLLHHYDPSIEQVAASCGFSDRYYFTKIFSRSMGISPGQYRKNSLVGI